MDDTTKLLHAIEAAVEEVRDEARSDREESRAHREKTDARLGAVETKLADVASLGEQNAKHIGEFNGSLLRVASGAAKAVDLALEAKQQASKATDEASKVVESALRIHGASIAASVTDVVKHAVQPLSDKIDTLEKNDAKQSATLAQQDTQLGSILGLVSKFARWQDHWAVKVGFALFTAIGGLLAGYFAHH